VRYGRPAKLSAHQRGEALQRMDAQELASDFERIKAEAAQGEYDLIEALRDVRNIQSRPSRGKMMVPTLAGDGGRAWAGTGRSWRKERFQDRHVSCQS
jgi:hypothetical protein